MLERVCFIFVSTFVLDAFLRAWLLSVCCLLALVLQVVARPFTRSRPNTLLAGMLGLLNLVALWEMGVAFRMTKHGTAGRLNPGLITPFVVLISLVSSLPAAVGLIFLMLKLTDKLAPGLYARIFRRQTTSSCCGELEDQPASAGGAGWVLEVEMAHDDSALPDVWEPKLPQDLDQTLC
mmetsp:Transcript_40067/g.86706  ORF Transcript_40067/g.86706 Transcript_40067/m.86706 type:complete len:179 (+) Transcript_40067:41-577(+)